MDRRWAIALIALWIVMAIAMNVALANPAPPAPAIPIDHLVDAFV
jgi:hypothetical protein